VNISKVFSFLRCNAMQQGRELQCCQRTCYLYLQGRSELCGNKCT